MTRSPFFSLLFCSRKKKRKEKRDDERLDELFDSRPHQKKSQNHRNATLTTTHQKRDALWREESRGIAHKKHRRRVEEEEEEQQQQQQRPKAPVHEDDVLQEEEKSREKNDALF